MEAKGLFNVARKEFIDHLTSRKFILILALFLIISAVAMHQGVGDYNNRLESYKEQISQVEEGEQSYMPEKPSILLIFQRMSYLMAIFGAVLGITMGFDLITREKESRSLKSLLSHPVYRDEIINGKAVGGILALTFAMGIALIILFAMLLILSIVPNMDEFWRIVLFGAVTIVFLPTYLSIALMASTVSKESGRALMYALIITFVISLGVPLVGGIISECVVEEPPQLPENQYRDDKEARQRYNEEIKVCWEKRGAIEDAINTFSPFFNYCEVSSVVLYGSTGEIWHRYGSVTVSKDVLEKIWKNVFAFLIFPIVFFAIAYVKFMRMDIR
ncbi:MAG: ABC transporter permease [Halobacteriota archaeon]